jgi:CO dehydrogenase nickel-insertion accessory protein CooC1
LLGELERDSRFVVFDMEAGMGTLLRLERGQADVVLAVAEPTEKSIDVARRAVEIASERARVIVVANRVTGDPDVEKIRNALPGPELAVVPEDAAITHAERQGRAPIDVAADAPAVQALSDLAEHLASM